MLGCTVVFCFDEVDAAMLEAFRQAGLVVHLFGLERGSGVRTQGLRLAIFCACLYAAAV